MTPREQEGLTDLCGDHDMGEAMRWTYRYCDSFRYIVTNETLVFGCPTAEEARHLADYLNKIDSPKTCQATEGNIAVAARIGFCRDCADELGTCPRDGLPCDPRETAGDA